MAATDKYLSELPDLPSALVAADLLHIKRGTSDYKLDYQTFRLLIDAISNETIYGQLSDFLADNCQTNTALIISETDWSVGASEPDKVIRVYKTGATGASPTVSPAVDTTSGSVVGTGNQEGYYYIDNNGGNGVEWKISDNTTPISNTTMTSYVDKGTINWSEITSATSVTSADAGKAYVITGAANFAITFSDGLASGHQNVIAHKGTGTVTVNGSDIVPPLNATTSIEPGGIVQVYYDGVNPNQYNMIGNGVLV